MKERYMPNARSAELLNPLGQADVEDAGLAHRPTDLNGKVACFIDNGQVKVDAFLDRVEMRLSERFKFARIVRKRKSKASSSCPDLAELPKNCDFVVAGIGL